MARWLISMRNLLCFFLVLVAAFKWVLWHKKCSPGKRSASVNHSRGNMHFNIKTTDHHGLLTLNKPRDDCKGIYLVLPLVMLRHQHCNFYNNKGFANAQKIPQRIQELSDCLENNLQRKDVCSVYLLSTCSAAESVWFVNRLNLNNNHKISIITTKNGSKVVTYKMAFKFISTFLVNRPAMFINSDTYLGAGFDRIDPKYMRDNRIFYALTRTMSERCPTAGFHCGKPYVGSHDGWLFVPTEPFPQATLDLLDFSQIDNGVESVFMWILHHKLKYKLLNPCKQLKLIHVHCAPVRPTERRRINQNLVKKWAKFSYEVPYSEKLTLS